MESGRFCSNCGVELRPEAVGVFAAVADDVFSLRERSGFLAALGHILRSPTRNTLALVADPAYRGHGKYFVASTGMFLAVTYGLVPALTPDASAAAVAATAQELPEPLRSLFQLYKKYEMHFQTVFLYTIFILTYIIGYFVLRLFARVRRTPREYLKLACLAGGTGTLAMLPVVAPSAAMPYVEKIEGIPDGLKLTVIIAYGALAAFLYIFYVIYNWRVVRRFWEMSFGRMFVAVTVMAVATWILFGGVGALIAVLLVTAGKGAA
jgi:hypothetical protein